MNNINKIVFDVYTGVLDMNYTKNNHDNLLKKIKKLYRYVISGYIFQLKRIKKKMAQINEFEPTKETYDNLRIAIYTVSTGKYDDIKNPIFVDKNIDYYVFTEQNLNSDLVWKKIDIPSNISTLPKLDQARFLKTHPHLFFKDYDYSIFIDGNVRITCDIKPLIYTMIKENNVIGIHRHQVRDCIYSEAKAIYAAGKANKKVLKSQIKKYKKDCFPEHYGLFETNIVIRKHNDSECIKIMEDWWNEMSQWTKRDQLSFTYSLWKNNKKSEYVMSLGNNSRRNPYFIVDSHK